MALEIDNPISVAVETIKRQHNIDKTNIIREEIKSNSEQQKAEIERFKNDTLLKKQMTYFVMCFTSVWSILILLLVTFKQLSDLVMVTYMTETLGIVLGLPTIVIWHFFPKNHD